MSMDSFFTRLNPLISGILRSPLHWLLSPGLLLITVTGRRTGRRYTIPVGYQRDGETLAVMVSEAGRKSWWRNYREPGPVEVRLRGRSHSGRAELVAPATDEFRRSATRTLQRMPWLGRVFGIDYDRRTGLSDEQLERLGEQIAMVRITLERESD
jgi:deazaflavin-dependent oxidoreductase (nitroreductase family)